MFVDCQEFQREGSGWAIDEVLYLKLMMAKYVPLKGSQYIDLPPKVKNSKAVINIQNDDDKCFLWSLLAYLYEPNYNRERVNHYKQYESELNMNGIAYPISVEDVPKFQKQNNISVNVFGYEDGYYPLYISRNQKEKHVNLLLIEKVAKHTTASLQISTKCYSPRQSTREESFSVLTVFMDLSGKICLTNTNHCVKNMAHNAQNYPVER